MLFISQGRYVFDDQHNSYLKVIVKMSLSR